MYQNQKHMRYSSWDTKWDRMFCHFGPFFDLLTTFPLTTQKKKVLKKLKKKWKCHHFKLVQQKKKRSYDVCLLRYGVLTQTIFCHFRLFFALLPHYWPQKLKFGKNIKKYMEILSFYTCSPLIKIISTPDMMYGSWEIKFNRENYFVILGIFLPFYLPKSTKNENIKNEKKPRRYHHFTKVYQKWWSSAILFQRCGARRM